MNIPFDLFRSEVSLLQQEIKAVLSKRETSNRRLIEDGIINLEEYYHAPVRVLWVLKEPYCKKDGTGGGWNMTDDLNTKRALGLNHVSHQTWYPITYATYGLLNGFMPFANMPNINTDPAVWLSLRKMAFINYQKLPAKPRTNETELRKQVTEEERQLVVRQIFTYRPHIVIGGKTLHLLKNDLVIQKEHELSNGHFQKDSILFLNTHHPAQTKITMQEYVDKINLRTKQWRNVYMNAIPELR
ncbi:MAG TPA: hypothetical protein VGN63_07775 [Flavisolibacter sp.]|jgi:hypothetical protein|nr:hypothetical protein [Flavisolibacter sp.]